MKDSPEFRGQMFWIYSGAEIVILVFSCIASFAAFVQVTSGLQNIVKLKPQLQLQLSWKLS